MPRYMVFYQMERLLVCMQHPEKGVPVRCQKLFLTTIPGAFTGCDLIQWLDSHLKTGDITEAKNLANMLCQHGYIFPIVENKTLQVKDDNTLYRFQSPYFWPSHNWQADNVDYAIYLVKRTMRNKQRHGLEEYEQNVLNKLQKMLCDKWDFIYMQAEEQVRLSKDRKKSDKLVIDGQERAYWRVHKPAPNQVQCLAEGVKRNYGPGVISFRKKSNVESHKKEIAYLQGALSQAKMKVSKIIESITSRCLQFEEIDPFICTPNPSNPWISDDTTLWVLNSCLSETPTESRVKRWGYSFEELLSDKMGRQEFQAYLKTEYSSENIRFYNSVRELKYCSNSLVNEKVEQIYNEFLSHGAPHEINIDSKTMDQTQKALKSPSRYIFDAAQSHIYLLMKKDSYPRFLRSELYKNLLLSAQTPCPKKKIFPFGNHRKSPVPSPSSSPQPLRRSSAESDISVDRRSSSVLSHHSFSTGNLRDFDVKRTSCDTNIKDNRQKSSLWSRTSPRSIRKKLEEMKRKNQDSPSRKTLEVPNYHQSSTGGAGLKLSHTDSEMMVNIAVPNRPSNVVAPWEESKST